MVFLLYIDKIKISNLLIMAQYVQPSHNNTIFNNSDFKVQNNTNNPILNGNNNFSGLNSFTQVTATNLSTGNLTTTGSTNIISNCNIN